MTTTRFAALTAALALTVTPAFAGVGVPTPVEDPKPPATETKSRAKAYGRYCRAQSKKHAKGEKGTAFSRCVPRRQGRAQVGAQRLQDDREGQREAPVPQGGTPAREGWEQAGRGAASAGGPGGPAGRGRLGG